MVQPRQPTKAPWGATPALALLATALWAPARGADAREFVAPGLLTLNDNGAWSWFEDERAVVDPVGGKLVFSSVADANGPGGAARSGDVDVVSVDLTSHAVDRFTLRDALQDDDHNSAALYVRPDGRYVAMYGGHLTDNFSRWRVSTNPGSVTSWAPEQTFNNGASMTYSNLHFLPDDRGGQGRLYNFVRSVGFDPNILVSTDQGSTWSYGGRLLAEGGSSDRPYVRYFSDGERIHLISTERHPRDFDNSIYHAYIQDGVLYNSTGAVVDANLLDGAAVAPSQLTPVLTTGSVVGGEVMRRGWTVDVAIDQGAPVAVFQMRAAGSDLDHRFFYARHNGAQWQVHPLGYAGSYLYAAENDYTGLVSIDPNDPSTVYLSSEVHPETQAQLIGADGQRHYELFRGKTANQGATWDWTPLTFNSTQDNLRPVVPEWDATNTAVLWMRGQYDTYQAFDTSIVGLVNPQVADAQAGLKVDFGATGQEVQPGFEGFSRPAGPAGPSATQSFASPFAASAGQVSVTVGGTLNFGDRGDDVAGPLGAAADDFVSASGALSLTLSGLSAGDYQLVLYGHDRNATLSAQEVSLAGVRLGAFTPTTGATPLVGIASSRVAFHADGASDVSFLVESLSGGTALLNGFELWAGSAYASPPPVDLNADGLLNLTDYLLYVDGLHADLTGLTTQQAYARGDLNGDLRNDATDLALFRQAYEQWNGAGALARALATAPEPAASAVAVLGLGALASGRPRRDRDPARGVVPGARPAGGATHQHPLRKE